MPVSSHSVGLPSWLRVTSMITRKDIRKTGKNKITTVKSGSKILASYRLTLMNSPTKSLSLTYSSVKKSKDPMLVKTWLGNMKFYNPVTSVLHIRLLILSNLTLYSRISSQTYVCLQTNNRGAFHHPSPLLTSTKRGQDRSKNSATAAMNDINSYGGRL